MTGSCKWPICLENFHTEYGKTVAPVPLLAETFNKEVSDVLCEKTYHSCGIIARVEIVKIAKGLFAKNALGN